MKWRDLTLLDLQEDYFLVIACDSAGGIGDKVHDIVRTAPRTVGYHTAKVAMMEILSVHGVPLIVSNTLSVEMDPTGKEIIRGIEELLKEYDSAHDIALTGSTEENFPVSVTGIGVTVLGKVEKSHWPPKRTKRDHLAVMVGEAQCGVEVLRTEEKHRLTLQHVRCIRDLPYVFEVVPGGSKGLIHEIKLIESSSQLRFQGEESGMRTLQKSCGPATALLVTLPAEDLPLFRKEAQLPVQVLGIFY